MGPAEEKAENHDLQYLASWGPWECIYVVSEAYKRFRNKNKGKVPLEGLQANQMLRVRPTALGPEGRLELVTGSLIITLVTLVILVTLVTLLTLVTS